MADKASSVWVAVLLWIDGVITNNSVIPSNVCNQMNLLFPIEAAYFSASGKIRPFGDIYGSCKGLFEQKYGLHRRSF